MTTPSVRPLHTYAATAHPVSEPRACDHCGEVRTDVRTDVPGQDGARCVVCARSILDHFVANAHDTDFDPSPADLHVEMARFWAPLGV